MNGQFTIPVSANTHLNFNANFLDLNQFLPGGNIAMAYNSITLPPGLKTWLNGFYKCRINGCKMKTVCDNLGAYTATPDGLTPGISPTAYFATAYASDGLTGPDMSAGSLPIQRFAKWKTMTQPGSTGARRVVSFYKSAASLIPDYVARQSANTIQITPSTSGAPAPTFAAGNGSAFIASSVGNISTINNNATDTTYIDVMSTFTVYMQAWDKVQNLNTP